MLNLSDPDLARLRLDAIRAAYEHVDRRNAMGIRSVMDVANCILEYSLRDRPEAGEESK